MKGKKPTERYSDIPLCDKRKIIDKWIDNDYCSMVKLRKLTGYSVHKLNFVTRDYLSNKF